MAKNKNISNWLEKIGSETNTESEIGSDGIVRSQTNYEVLARLLFKQALGYVETVKDESGQTIRQQVHMPDKTSQQVILERLEGKPVTADESSEKLPELLDRVSKAVVDKINKITNDRNHSTS